MVSHNSDCTLREKRKESKKFLDSNLENILNYLCFLVLASHSLKDLLTFLFHETHSTTMAIRDNIIPIAAAIKLCFHVIGLLSNSLIFFIIFTSIKYKLSGYSP